MSTTLGDRTLLVASVGGHLEELWRLSARLRPASGVVEWATSPDAQVTSLLAGQRVHLLRYVPPRGYTEAARNVGRAVLILRSGHFDRIVTTGAGSAIPFMIAGRALGIPVHYIESAARAEGPSLTGKVAERIPGTRLYSQYVDWASPRWVFRGSVFDPIEVTEQPARTARRVVVTLGTMRTFGFRSAVEAVVRTLPGVAAPDMEVLWQVGATDCRGLEIEGRVAVPARELKAAIAEADLVIAHAGVGSALSALDSGKVPILLPRRARRGEHVDDHQLMIARSLADRGLAITADTDELTGSDLARAMCWRAVGAAGGQDFLLS